MHALDLKFIEDKGLVSEEGEELVSREELCKVDHYQVTVVVNRLLLTHSIQQKLLRFCVRDLGVKFGKGIE